jgi:hypothetical protein
MTDYIDTIRNRGRLVTGQTPSDDELVEVRTPWACTACGDLGSA